MKIPDDAIIPEEKLTRYLLVQRARNDKPKFLARAGFTINNPEALRSAIQAIAKNSDALADGMNEYGTFYRVTGQLKGVNGVSLPVVTIWLQRHVDAMFKFVTLKPLKEPQA